MIKQIWNGKPRGRRNPTLRWEDQVGNDLRRPGAGIDAEDRKEWRQIFRWHRLQMRICIVKVVGEAKNHDIKSAQ